MEVNASVSESSIVQIPKPIVGKRVRLLSNVESSKSKFLTDFDSIHKKIFEDILKPNHIDVELIAESGENSEYLNTCEESFTLETIENAKGHEVPKRMVEHKFIFINFTNSDRLTIAMFYCFINFLNNRDNINPAPNTVSEILKYQRVIDLMKDMEVPLTYTMVRFMLENIFFNYSDEIKTRNKETVSE